MDKSTERTLFNILTLVLMDKLGIETITVSNEDIAKAQKELNRHCFVDLHLEFEGKPHFTASIVDCDC
jgi:hypothetical protein